MKKNNLPADYWNKRYEEGRTGWNIGYASPAIIAYFDQVSDKNSSILIPGAGFGHEVVALYHKGFRHVHFMDYASEVVDAFKKEHPEFPEDQIIQKDFFSLEKTFDFIIEQTFFCALLPSQRPAYVNKIFQLLHGEGKLIGLFFNRIFEKDGPPFGATLDQYQNFFRSKFNIRTLAPCYNSIPERQGNELFFIFQKENKHQ
ncbi:TPMT family class I SAM-dependent methyltransferase [Aquimarina sp. ERC-38]|uniref:methyltransferase domain-containing protein n=1 Tax=Aquimarina sp. ERC-38 TaxID=2949996 RepID=UPI0022463C8E|nr:methyltransferase domain-containing protein [Aquimarina sp. ERC-38]UZO80887.1 TPMT family class I SAM-dependent methyltransferase [Aquimarina sp. ERC-38]